MTGLQTGFHFPVLKVFPRIGPHFRMIGGHRAKLKEQSHMFSKEPLTLTGGPGGEGH